MNSEVRDILEARRKFAKGRDMIELAEDARDAAQKAIDLDDQNDLAYLVLGAWNREIATVGGLAKFAAKVIYGGVPEGASLENSEFLLRRAVTLAPEHLNHHQALRLVPVVEIIGDGDRDRDTGAHPANIDEQRVIRSAVG
jgi:hypothetical protein